MFAPIIHKRNAAIDIHIGAINFQARNGFAVRVENLDVVLTCAELVANRVLVHCCIRATQWERADKATQPKL